MDIQEPQTVKKKQKPTAVEWARRVQAHVADIAKYRNFDPNSRQTVCALSSDDTPKFLRKTR